MSQRYDAEQRSVRKVVQGVCSASINQNAERLFNVIDEDNSQPIVLGMRSVVNYLLICLVPDRRSFLSTLLTIPAACSCIVQKNGVNEGVWSAGLHMCANYAYE